MGRGGRSRTQRRHFRQNRENVWKRSKSEPSDQNDSATGDAPHRAWEPFATQNPMFDEYYKEQRIVSAEEWDSFTSMLRTPLPAAFRINSNSQFYKDIRSELENDFMVSLQAEAIDGGEVDPIRPLPWYPRNLAWHSNFSRMQLRKNQSLERFHEFLKLENEIGNITRQEAVSMVPPLFLDVSPDHFVLDMCAAPGSKTFQLLETVYQSCKPGCLPSGLIVANDVDVQRCNLLIHQTKRMCTANLIVTNHEAQHFPGCRIKNNVDASGETVKELGITQLQFDRVLCDVPCSGDGTLRKAPDIWRKWNAGMGNGVHNLQVQIAMRGLSLLKVGGRMVYSTCSMNPVENEAVVSELLLKCGGSVELIDVSNELPQLIRRPGLKTWKVRDKGAWLASFKKALNYRRNLIVPSMFPSGRSDDVDSTDNCNVSAEESQENQENGSKSDSIEETSETLTALPEDEFVEEVSEFPLERCMRIVPHDQNTGAFFVAVLCKHSALPATACQEKPKIEEKLCSSNIGADETLKNEPIQNSPDEIIEDTNGGLESNSAGGTEEKNSEVEIMDNEPDEVGPEVEAHIEEEETGDKAKSDTTGEAKARGGKRKLQIQGKWKGVDPVLFFQDEAIIESIRAFYGIDESFPLTGLLVSRNLDNNHVKRIYYVSESVRDVLQLNFSVGQQLKIASVGLKMFERQTSREGNSTRCAFRISSEGLPVILPHVTKQILHANLSDFKHLLEYKSIKYADFVEPELGTAAEALLQGCCVVVLRNDYEGDESRIAIGCWKGKSSLSVMVTAIDCQELLQRLANRQTNKAEQRMES